MLSLWTQVSQSQLDGVARLWEGFRRGASEPYPLHEDPPPTTPYEVDDVVHPTSSLVLPDLIGSHDKRDVVFPTGHIGAVVSGAAHTQLWPQVGSWLKDRESKPGYQ